jgi:uncharacterized iron-regulated protein
MAFRTIAVAALALLFSCAHRVEVRDLATGKVFGEDRLVRRLPDRGTIVIGEHHYTPVIQEAEGRLIRKVVTEKYREAGFTVGWEFLPYHRQPQITAAMERWQNGGLGEWQFLKALFPEQKTREQHRDYLPMLEAVRDLRGQLLGLNAPDDWKKAITQRGLARLPESRRPTDVPPATDAYRDRFTRAMKHHVRNGKTLEHYFEAQTYTDAVMAWALRTGSHHSLRFVIAGSFHTDYQDGVVRALARTPEERPVTIKMIDATALEDEAVDDLVAGDEKYGKIADYLYIIR